MLAWNLDLFPLFPHRSIVSSLNGYIIQFHYSAHLNEAAHTLTSWFLQHNGIWKRETHSTRSLSVILMQAEWLVLSTHSTKENALPPFLSELNGTCPEAQFVTFSALTFLDVNLRCKTIIISSLESNDRIYFFLIFSGQFMKITTNGPFVPMKCW